MQCPKRLLMMHKRQVHQALPNKDATAYAQVSVLEHCQLRCAYCLPEAHSLLAKKAWLSLAQYESLARIFARFSFKKIRFTAASPY